MTCVFLGNLTIYHLKVSVDWLKDYVQFEGHPNDELVEILPMLGLEVERSGNNKSTSNMDNI